MSKYYCWCLVAALLATAGCRKAETASSPPAAPPPSTGALPSLTAPSAPPPPGIAPPPSPGAPPPPPGAPLVAVAPTSGAQANGLVQPVDSEGNAMTAEKVLNRALEIYVEGMGKPVPKDLNELVQAKVLQAIPPAPAGRKWVFDPKQGKIVLASQ